MLGNQYQTIALMAAIDRNGLRFAVQGSTSAAHSGGKTDSREATNDPDYDNAFAGAGK
jgi:hypothetical protein